MRVPGFGSSVNPTANWPGARAAAGAFGWRRALIGLLVLGGSSVAGYQVYQRTLGVPIAAPAASQSATAARRSIVERVSLPGSVAAARQSKLSFAASGNGVSVSGTVKGISVRTGDAVKTGQELARLDTTSLEFAAQSSQAALTIARIKFAQLIAGALPPDVASATQAVVSAQASVARAEGDLQSLRDGGSAADRATVRQSVLAAQNALTTAQQALDTIQARAARDVEAGNLQQTLDTMNRQLVSAKSELEAAAGASSGSNVGSMALSSARDAADLVRERCSALSSRDRCAEIAVAATDGASLLAALDRGTEGPRGMAGIIANFNAIVPSAGAATERAAFRLIQATAATPSLAARVNALVFAVGSGGGIPSADALANAARALDGALATLTAARARQDALVAGQPAGEQNLISAVDTARAGLVTAIARRDDLLDGPLPTDIQLQQQSVLQAELSLRRAQNDLAGAVLVAPFDGLVGPVTMTVGEPSGAGSIILVDPLSMQLNAAVQEADVVRLRPGQSVNLTFDALAGTTLQGRLFSISPSADVVQGVSSYAVVVEIPARTGAAGRVDLRTGMAGTAAVEISRRDNTLALPVRALKRQGRDQIVEVQVGAATETRIVKIGATDGTFTEVTDGLKEGDVVVLPTATTTTRPATTGASSAGGPPAGGPPPGGGPGR